METTLIDRGAPRSNQFTVGVVLIGLFVLDLPAGLPVVAAILLLGVALGRRFVPGYALWYGLLRRATKAPWVEDERAPRFAQAMGASGILAGYAVITSGSTAVGWGLILVLAAAALFAAATGICFGCLTYRMIAKLGGIVPSRPTHLDPADVPLPELRDGQHALVEFGHPLCSDCQAWQRRLETGTVPFTTVNVAKRPEVAARYGVAVLPTVLKVAGDGRVLRQVTP